MFSADNKAPPLPTALHLKPVKGFAGKISVTLLVAVVPLIGVRTTVGLLPVNGVVNVTVTVPSAVVKHVPNCIELKVEPLRLQAPEILQFLVILQFRLILQSPAIPTPPAIMSAPVLYVVDEDVDVTETAPVNFPVVPETGPENVPVVPETGPENVPVNPETAPENDPLVAETVPLAIQESVI